MFKESLITLAVTRQTIKVAEAKLADAERELKQREPELVTELENIRTLLAENRSKEKSLAISIRQAALENPVEAYGFKPWLQQRMTTVVEVIDLIAKRTAMLFCPEALTLNKKVFDDWAISHRNEPLLSTLGIVIEERQGFIIKSDLEEYLEKIEMEANL